MRNAKAASWFLGSTLAWSILAGCSLFQSSDGEKTGQVVPSSGGGGGSAGGAGGADASAGGGAPSGGQGGAPASKCAGLPGPSMVEIATPNGAKFCIDRTEVTQGQYAEFLKSTTGEPGSEHAECSDNTSYAPKTNLPGPAWEPSTCTAGVVWTPDKTPNRPVVCIDWCDAFAYCAWAGKRMCGKVGGGRNLILGKIADPTDPANDPNVSQWYAACSQGGKSVYPYGDNYDPLACEGYDSGGTVLDSGKVGPSWQQKKDVGTRAGCRGTNVPYANLRDLSGGVAELTDECALNPSSPGLAYSCAFRGGGFLSQQDGLTCAQYATSPYPAEYIGFRCCKDLP